MPASPRRSRATSLAAWLALLLLWAILLASAWTILRGNAPDPSAKQDCLTTSNGERSQELQRRGYQVVSEDVQPDGSKEVTLCR